MRLELKSSIIYSWVLALIYSGAMLCGLFSGIPSVFKILLCFGIIVHAWILFPQSPPVTCLKKSPDTAWQLYSGETFLGEFLLEGSSTMSTLWTVLAFRHSESKKKKSLVLLPDSLGEGDRLVLKRMIFLS